MCFASIKYGDKTVFICMALMWGKFAVITDLAHARCAAPQTAAYFLVSCIQIHFFRIQIHNIFRIRFRIRILILIF
jgi:hypothetical protein